ncbi:phenylalanine--tRNA ligase subunit alpha [Anaerofustis stercorihominis]|uniref:Phenylalanine--tRNA ligase alpha subunit n=1 Tax=Anaerofustis stercorihominis DSM 17244 TaxID=445971 RepID=B1C8B5_9FIRM|nr:phenylalanine--tRNA ligase, alpha subunit [Anaerofustis stercorihominis DSM 17244]MCQ4794548.1 phenylalanine--tRNA ligase subunit alpha [Anaerofustis stercorihominis]
MKNQLLNISEEAKEKIQNLNALEDLENFRIEFLGKKGKLTSILRGMGGLSKEERPIIGKLANEVRADIEEELNKMKSSIEDKLMEEKLKRDKIDITLPGKEVLTGHHHPLYHVIGELQEIFESLGFSVAEGPEVELVKYNFDNLNVPLDHSSRDESDTFYVEGGNCLRTQTSPVQIRAMKDQELPIKVIAPGKVYRTDEIDATHSPLFHQLEGLIVDKGITMADLKGTLEYVVKKLYGEDTKTRFRPHQFYFTEPSAEMDATCVVCKGKGCNVCKGSGYIEILGCGMVHPNVLRACGIDPEVYSGFAFGLGLDRMTTLKYGIKDLRLLFGNDTELLTQF